MNWYKMLKIAFPYGRVKCPKCHVTFLNDYGYQKVDESHRVSTMDVSRNPFVQHDIIEYPEPIESYDPDTEETSSVTKDEVETGNVTTQCPHCYQWLEISYQFDSRANERDAFSETKTIDVEPIPEALVGKYQESGMPTSYSVPI